MTTQDTHQIHRSKQNLKSLPFHTTPERPLTNRLSALAGSRQQAAKLFFWPKTETGNKGTYINYAHKERSNDNAKKMKALYLSIVAGTAFLALGINTSAPQSGQNNYTQEQTMEEMMGTDPESVAILLNKIIVGE